MARSTRKSRKARRRPQQTGNKKKRAKATSPAAKATESRSSRSMVFSKQNYLLLLAGLFLIVFGFTIMRMENEVDGFISLYIAPLIILGGYLEIIYAIMWRPKKQKVEAVEAPEAE